MWRGPWPGPARRRRAFLRACGFQGYDPVAFLSGDAEAIDRSLLANLGFKRRSAKKHSGYWRDLAVRRHETDTTEALRAHAGGAAARHSHPMWTACWH